MELVGEGSTRRICLTVRAFLVLSGTALQGLASWYRVQAIREEWVAAVVQAWLFAIGVWILAVVLALALLRKRLKKMQKGRTSERKTSPV